MGVKVGGPVGWLWTVVWMLLWGNILVDGVYRRGSSERRSRCVFSRIGTYGRRHFSVTLWDKHQKKNVKNVLLTKHRPQSYRWFQSRLRSVADDGNWSVRLRTLFGAAVVREGVDTFEAGGSG